MTMRPTPAQRRLTPAQIKRRLKAVVLDLAAIGGGYHLTKPELRRRALTLQGIVQEMIDRYPNGRRSAAKRASAPAAPRIS